VRLRGGVKPGHFWAESFRTLIRRGGRGCLQWRRTQRVDGLYSSREEQARGGAGLWAADTISKMCRYSAPPGYVRSKEPERPKLGPLIPVIDTILEADKTDPPKQRHTAKLILERLRIEHGYAGGYTAVKRHAFEPNSRERCVLITINSALSGARCAHVTGFAVPGHHGSAAISTSISG
jgi:hypothetical protein